MSDAVCELEIHVICRFVILSIYTIRNNEIENKV
jgi:hypothetical protein